MSLPDHEVISVIIAAIAMVFVLVEAFIKYHGSNAEKKTLFYSKYLYIIQQLDIGTLAVGKLIEMAESDETDPQILAGFAHAHIIPDDVIKCISDYQELAFFCLKSKSNSFVKMALDFGQTAETIAESINSFFRSVITGEEHLLKDATHAKTFCSPTKKQQYENMNESFGKLKSLGMDNSDILSSGETLSDVMRNVIINQKRWDCIIRNGYLLTCLVLFCICAVYIILLIFGVRPG